MKHWSFFVVSMAIVMPVNAFSMPEMNFLYLPKEFVSQRINFCRSYFPKQSSTYEAAHRSWLAKNGKYEAAFQKAFRTMMCQKADCETDAKSDKDHDDGLKKQAKESLKRDMLKLSKADEQQATAECKETLQILADDTLNLGEMAEAFQRRAEQ